MKTIVLDGQTYELRPIEDKKQFVIEVEPNWLPQPAIYIYIPENKEKSEAIRDAVEALMEYIYGDGKVNVTVYEAAGRAKELLKQ